MIINCEWCGKEFHISPSRLGKSKYCCRNCYTASCLRREDVICKNCQCTFEAKSSEVSRGGGKFCSPSCSSTWHSGVNNSRYNSSLTSDERAVTRNFREYRKWRLDVYNKDNFTCQKCGECGGKLNAHHILGYARYKDARLLVDNGETLCYRCHKEFHKLYGIVRFTDKDYWEWLSE